MPSIEENLEFWDAYDWSRKGEEWSWGWGEGGSAWQWQTTIYPRIQDFLPVGTLLDLGCGYGRWLPQLSQHCQQLLGVDLLPRCVESCAELCPEGRFLSTDGRSLAGVEDASVDFVFSFETLVLAELDVCQDYLKEVKRVLKPDGAAFLHHSNLGEYDLYFTLSGLIPAAMRERLNKIGWLDIGQWRAATVTAENFATAAHDAGLQCLNQELINWGTRRLIDCFTTLVGPESSWKRPPRTLRNRGFTHDVHYWGRLAELYHPGTSQNK